MANDKLRSGGLIQAFYWILFGGTINRLTREFGKREGKWRELQQQSIEQHRWKFSNSPTQGLWLTKLNIRSQRFFM